MYTKKEIKKIITEKGINLISVSYIDFASKHRAKANNIKYLDETLNEGIRFAKGNFQMTQLTGLANTYGKYSPASGETNAIPDLSTFVINDYAPKVAKFIGNLHELNGSPWNLCTRRPLQKALEIAKKQGYKYIAGGELEFHLVNKVNGVIKEVDTGEVQSQHGLDINHNILQQFINSLQSIGIPVPKVHMEGGGKALGHVEINLEHAEALRTGDMLIHTKDVLKAIAKKNNMICSFMPKISEFHTGSGMHIHSSLWNNDGENEFYDSKDERGYNLSQNAYYFIGGLLSHIKALCAICCPSINSYKRLVPGNWNSDGVIWSLGNRAAAVRVPEQFNHNSARIELRIPDSSANPYMVIACILIAGLDGIKNKIDPGKPFDLDLSDEISLRKAGIKLLPGTLREALDELENDVVLTNMLGKELVEEYIKNRRFECIQYASKVTDWEQENLLELV